MGEKSAMYTKRTRRQENNLPVQLSTFIGREREIAEVKQLLSKHRLLTLTGAGGSGKTRLSLKAAGELSGEFEDGVWFVELASVNDPALVTESVASTLNIREQPGQSMMNVLAGYFSTREALLIMDNCEHLISACAQFIENLLQNCPDIRILVTSREVLGIPGEIVWAVPPLSLPIQHSRSHSGSIQSALHLYGDSESVQLFVTRANAISSEFQLTTENGIWVAEICRRLDGMPLAIELAAARVRSLSVQQIAKRLNDRFHLLTGGSRTAPPRQQTLESAIEWSYSLLSPVEQKVLKCLSVFIDDATLTAAEWVCAAGSESTLNILSRLVDKSLLTAVRLEDGEIRYRLLETIRQYAGRKLEESADAVEIKNKHLDYFLQQALNAEPYLKADNDRATWLEHFELASDNLRAALEWSALDANRIEKGLRLITIAASFWKLHGYYKEARLRLATLLAHEIAHKPTLLRAKALYVACVFSFLQSDYPAVKSLAEESLSIFRMHGSEGRLGVANALEMLGEVASEIGDYSTATIFYEEALPIYRESEYLFGISETLRMMGYKDMRGGNWEQAESYMEESLEISRQSKSQGSIASSLCALGELAVRQGRFERAQSLLTEGLRINQQLGEKWGIAVALGSLGWLALRQDNFDEMRNLLRQSLDIRIETGDRGGMAWCLEKIAEANHLKARFQPAATIFGAAATLRAPVGSMMDAADQPGYESMISSLKTALGKDMFEAAWAEGQSMPLKLAVDYALAEPKTMLEKDLQKDDFGGLTKREQETANLIAQGKSNREIAKMMTVGVKTVETYVTRILKKLRLNSRVQIAAWMIERNFNKKKRQDEHSE